MTIRRPIVLFIASLVIVTVALALASAYFPDLWSSPDLRADRLFRNGKYEEAAMTYRDPYRRGIALYRADEFKEAAAVFATVATPDAAFDWGNALVMQGKYAEAITSYDRALALKKGWKEATDNRAIAVIRRDRMIFKGGSADITLKADKYVFEKGKKSQAGEESDVAGGKPLSDEEMRALWLRRVQTKPADFLRAKFAFQAQEKEGNSP